MADNKISLYTKIVRFFLRDLCNDVEKLSQELSVQGEKIVKDGVDLQQACDKITNLEVRTEKNYIKMEDNIDSLKTYNQNLENRLKSDDITTIELSHRIEVLEKIMRDKGLSPSDFELFNKRTYSQSGEDAIIMYIMAMLGIPLSECNYLDLGANRPKVMSNTYFFYEQGARGVLVEANCSLIPELEKERAGDIILNKCITGKSGDKVKFNVLNLDGLSKVGDISDILHENPNARVVSTTEIETISVNDIIDKYFNKKAPVILNLDIEGLEKQILDSIDFEKYRPLIMIIEMIPYSTELTIGKKDDKLLEYVKSKGYTEYAFTGINSIFIDERH